MSITGLCQDTEPDNRLCIKIAPLSFLDIYSGSSIRAGVEYKLKGRTSLYHEIGTYLPNINGYSNATGITAKTEFKFYLNPDRLTTGSYLSAEVFYKHQSFSTWDSINIYPAYRKDYHLSKNAECVTVKFGTLEVYKKRFVVDCFAGIGIRFSQIKNSLTSEENNHIQPSGDYSLNILVVRAGKFTYPNIDFGIKIGLRVK